MEELEDTLDLQELSLRLQRDPTFINAFDKGKDMTAALKAKVQKYKKQKRNFLATIQGSTGSGKSIEKSTKIIYYLDNRIVTATIAALYEDYRNGKPISVLSTDGTNVLRMPLGDAVEVYDDRPMIGIHTEDGRHVIGTVDHSFLRFDPGIKAVRGDQLRIGDQVPVNINGLLWGDMITKIDNLKPTTEPLYDLCVPGTENFMLANGLFVHNSYSMLSLAHLISGEQFEIDNVFYRLSDAIRAFDKLEPGSTILIDERTRIWGAGAYRIAAEWSNFTEVIRKFQINILNSTPREMMDVLYTNRFETLPCQIDFVREVARVAIQSARKETLGYILVRHPKHTVGMDFIKEYEKRKDKFLMDIMKHSDKGHIRTLADEFMESDVYKRILERFPSGPKYHMLFEAVDAKYPHLQRNQEVAEIARKVEYIQYMEMGMSTPDEKKQQRKYDKEFDIAHGQRPIDQYF